MTNDLLTPAQLEHANALLSAWLGDRNACRLGEACRAIDRDDRDDQALHSKVTPRLISSLLRTRGFKKTGMSGNGYDREAVYSKSSGGADILQLDPREVFGGEPAQVFWFSPDCKHGSFTKSGALK